MCFRRSKEGSMAGAVSERRMVGLTGREEKEGR